MAKKTKKLQIVAPIDALGEAIVKPLEIKSAHLKDMFCNYAYELLTGVGKGDVLNRKGSSLIHEDMRSAFKRLEVHLAIIDDAFKGKDIENLNQMINEDIVDVFNVDGIDITGSETNSGVVIHGSKWVDVGGNISLKTPKIKFDGKYEFLDDLQDAVTRIQIEVEAYMNGKVDPNNKPPEFEFASGSEDDFNAENAL